MTHPQTPDSTTHWACDEKINEGCCGCSGHECNKFERLIGDGEVIDLIKTNYIN